MTISSWIEHYAQQIPVFMIVQARLSALFAALYFLHRDYVPTRIVIAMTFLLSLYIIALGLAPPITSTHLLHVIPELLLQLFLGALTGLVVNFFMEIFLGFGQVVSLQSGLGMAQMFVPKLGSITSLTQFFVLVATVIFFQLNGHLILLKLIIHSFEHHAFTLQSLNALTFKDILDYSSVIFSGALMLSLSVVIAVMMSNLTIGLMSKFSPQINIFSVGINISLIICFFSIYISFDLITENGTVLLNDTLDFVKKMQW